MRHPRPITRRDFLAGAGALGAGLLAGCAGSNGAAGSAPAAADVATRDIIYDTAADPALDTTTVSIGMIGDVLVHTSVWESGEQADGTRNYDALFEHIAADAQALDVAMLDQETILGGTSVGSFSGFPTFNSPQEFADAEVKAGFDVIAHASNHAMDMGFEGIQSDLAYWREHYPETLVTGIYDSEELSEQIPIIERNGHKIAVLNYTATTNDLALPSDKPWCVNMMDSSRVKSDFTRARELGAEIIVACPHCGIEYDAAPSGYQVNWVEKYVELGADVVFCNHPHVLQPVEWYDNPEGRRVPVFWSLGNFVSTMSKPEALVGGFAHVTFTFSESGYEVTAAGLTPLVTHKIYGPGLTTYKLADYTEELAEKNAIRTVQGVTSFTRQWCIDFCAERLGSGFDSTTCEFTL